MEALADTSFLIKVFMKFSNISSEFWPKMAQSVNLFEIVLKTVLDNTQCFEKIDILQSRVFYF